MSDVPGIRQRVVRFEVLPGLPGEGPVPKHFHTGHPTPWAEGFVVRFWNEDGTNWVGNFQAGITEFSTCIELPEASMAVIVSGGACYFLALDHPKGVTVQGDDITRILLSETRSVIVAHLAGAVRAFDYNGTPAWTRADLGANELVLKSCSAGSVVADVEDWEGHWHTIRLAEMDGSDLL
jgi:hypothetical protein